MEEAAAKGFLTAYQELGVAGLFILLYITTVLYLIRTLVKDKEDEKTETKNVVNALNSATVAMKGMADSMDELKEMSREQNKNVDAMMTYMKLRDSFNRR
jgi:hypothetical protein